jgi:hypothetical protein
MLRWEERCSEPLAIVDQLLSLLACFRVDAFDDLVNIVHGIVIHKKMMTSTLRGAAPEECPYGEVCDAIDRHIPEDGEVTRWATLELVGTGRVFRVEVVHSKPHYHRTTAPYVAFYPVNQGDSVHYTTDGMGPHIIFLEAPAEFETTYYAGRKVPVILRTIADATVIWRGTLLEKTRTGSVWEDIVAPLMIPKAGRRRRR